MHSGDRIGERFLLRRLLAPEVWLAFDERLGRDVVLKRSAAGEPRAMARLNHPHVIAVYEHVEDLAVLEYAPGGSLAGRQLPAVEAARIGAQVADALAYMHGKGLVHCDVKPGNIVLTEAGMAKLTDFGSAYRVDPDATITPVSQLSYTPIYAAPELMRGSPVPASDVYSLAATVRALVTDVPPTLAEMLSPDPHDRPNAAEARRCFQALADGIAPTVGAGPAQLPAEVYGFAGRAAELERLDRMPAPVVVVSGTAGVGKTTLAVHWAHQVAGRFPDGQLYVNLRGFDPTGQGMDPADAIRGFLDALGIAPEQIPADLDAQAALYRSSLSTKRVLIVLDNARDTEQVRPLLPGNPNCQVIVTSRNDLIGLIAKEGARPLTLDVLSDDEARQLLDHRLGTERTAAEPQAVQDIINSCARLPLALAIVTARAAIRPDFPLATLTNALAGDDPDTDVHTVFSWSYDQLRPDAQRLFRLLGLHPGPDISSPAAASLTGTPRPPLAELTRTNLLTEHTPGRYTFHDLLRTYATELAHAQDPEEHRRAAIHRVLDHYLHSAETAADRLFPPRRRTSLTPAQPDVAPETFTDHEQALTWFAAEHATLLASINQAADNGFDTCVWQLVTSTHTYFGLRGHLHDDIAAWQAALRAAQRLGNAVVQASAHRSLADNYARLDNFDDAHTHLLQALDLFSELGNKGGLARTHKVLDVLYSRQGQHSLALDHAQQALDLHKETGSEIGQAQALNAVGWHHIQLGHHQRALEYCEQALDLFDKLDVGHGQAATLDTIGYAHHHLGQFELASSSYQRALHLSRGIGDRDYEAEVLTHIAALQEAVGDLEQARDTWRLALSIVEELGRPETESVRANLVRLDRSPPGN